MVYPPHVCSRSWLLPLCMARLVLSSAHAFEFDAFRDGCWKIINRANSAVLIADGHGAGHCSRLCRFSSS